MKFDYLCMFPSACALKRYNCCVFQMCKITSVGGSRRKGSGSGCLSRCINRIDAAKLLLGNREKVPLRYRLLQPIADPRLRPCAACVGTCSANSVASPTPCYLSRLLARSPLPTANANTDRSSKTEAVQIILAAKVGSCHPMRSSSCTVLVLLSSLIHGGKL